VRRVTRAWLVGLLLAIGSAAPAAANYTYAGDVVGAGRDDVPVGVTVDQHSGRFYVLDARHDRIQVYAPPNTLIGSWGSFGFGLCQFQQYGGIAVDPASGDIVFADAFNDRVERCSADGSSFVGQFKTQLTPGGVAVLPSSASGGWRLVVAAADFDPKVEVIQANGHWVRWGTEGTGPGELVSPPNAVAANARTRGIYVDSFDDSLSGSSRIEEFTEGGHFVRQWRFTDLHNEHTEVRGMAIDPDGDVLAVGQDACVQKFTNTGKFVTEFACDKPGAVALAADRYGNVYLADPSTGTVAFYSAVTPSASITGGPSGGAHWSDPTPSFAFKASEPGSTFACRPDSHAWGACPSPHATGHLADGKHTLSVRATDPDGLTGAVFKTGFTIDTRAPKLTISGAAVRLSSAGAAKIGVTCPSSEATGPCSGQLFLHTADPRSVGGHRLESLLGLASFTIAAGHTKQVKVTLVSGDRAVLAGLGSVTASAVVNVRDALDNRADGLTRTFTLKAPAA
jgi:hypothetical protein